MGYYYSIMTPKGEGEGSTHRFFFFLLSNFTHADTGTQTPNLDQHLTMAISGGGAK